ncbi:SDR family NAD(P)-dependent oxidoreductase [Microbacterium oryzae]|uniref:SDR family NAD(P)-dependent oxidoreductase n=1 Tax=Microbacterium oryzae TaxID=743009 RepID=A0A6I6E8N4_9MICO|nr:SDR family NAD(P)-dependent oxidoreductase [Microbacterium oryzae]QGU27558.1 SDR family NAD(P)-dependent oxidoreductase [Microbacterium oryzae]
MTKRRVLWVTGAGSGMGRAAAIAAGTSGWRVAVSGRRADALAETAAQVRAAGGEAFEVPVDVRDAAALADAHARIAQSCGPVDALVLAAGLNAPRRNWANQSLEEFAAIVDTNLTSIARAVDLVLPGMRQRERGDIVVISSRAGWRFSPDSGVAYSASKTALSPLVSSINDQEGRHDIEACHLCPGEVDTDFLDLRPNVPGAEQRATMLTADDVGRAVQFVLESPPHVRIDELVISPASQR